jgi:hypothetical protein
MNNYNPPPRKVQVYFAPKSPEQFWAEVYLWSGLLIAATVFAAILFVRKNFL